MTKKRQIKKTTRAANVKLMEQHTSSFYQSLGVEPPKTKSIAERRRAVNAAADAIVENNKEIYRQREREQKARDEATAQMRLMGLGGARAAKS